MSGVCERQNMATAPRSVQPTRSEAPVEDSERRVSGRRKRARDRLMDRATRDYPKTKALRGQQADNLLLFIDDDLRETALAMERIERYLTKTLEMLECNTLSREQVHELAVDTSVLDYVDLLNESLESLRRRMARLSGKLR